MLLNKTHKKLVLNLRDQSRVTSVVPSARTLEVKGQTLVAVPHRLDEVRVLRNLGFDPPTPMGAYYDWPGRYPPYAHQNATGEFLSTNPRAFCLNGMGCIAGDDLVRVSRKGKSYETDLRTLHRKFHELPDKETWKARTLMGDRFGMNQLLDVLYKGEKPTLRITLSCGKTFRATPDHRIARPCGQWTEAGDLSIGDELVTNGKVTLVCPHCGNGREVSKYYAGSKRSQSKQCRQCKDAAHSATMAREKNPAFKGEPFVDKDGYVRVWAPDHHRADNSGRVYEHILVAEAAFGIAITSDLHVHHKNEVKSDNAPNNLEVLPAADHHRHHDPRVNLDGSISAKGGQVVVLPRASKIVSIEDGGTIDVYDLCMEAPHHNFVVNGVVVHNSGKTLSVLWAFDYLKKSDEVDWMLVVSPLSTLERAWGDEIYRHFPHLNFTVLHGTREKRLKLINNDFDIYVINHDGVKGKDVLEALCNKPGRGLVVIDEIAVARNASTELWKSLNVLVNGNPKTGVEPKKWAWGLTGTPIPNTPTDAWAQVKLINPGRVGRYFGHFRDKVMKQITQFKWVAREGALDHVFEVMQPAIRFAREDCIDLPPTTVVTRQTELTSEQKAAFDTMLRKFRAEHDGGEITAVNEAVKLSKLLQICCLRYDTEVLTDRGWVQIQHVCIDDLVWDGEEWVSHSGAALMGHKPTVECGGIYLTDDHLVLSTRGWVTAKEFNSANASQGLDWAEVRLPHGFVAGRKFNRGQQESPLVVPVRVRGDSRAREPILAVQAPETSSQLWVSPREPDPRYDQDPSVQHMGDHAQSVPMQSRQGLVSIRGARHNRLRQMARFVSGVLGRHVSWLQGHLDFGTGGQRRSVLEGKLSLGDSCAAGQQSPVQHCGEHHSGEHDHVRGCQGVRLEASNFVRQGRTIRLAPGEGPVDSRVYDIVNCGARNRFVVRGDNGELRIVHNCGVAYGADDTEVIIPAKPRIELVREIIEEAEAKVLVFVPFTAALKVVAEELSKSFTVQMVHGGVSKTQRDVIFKDFQQAKDPRVIVADARTMAHGITLTAANTVVWYAPPYSAEIYQQACARVTRPGQKLNTLIVNIQATPMEGKIYERLSGKERMQGLLLSMLKGT